MIQVEQLTKRFGNLTAVAGLSLHVAQGEIYGLVGPDGAGKTTTIRLLCGALRPDAGQISIAGYDVRRQVEAARSQIGYLPQRFSLYEELTVLENLRFFAEVRGLKTAEWRPRCLEILNFVGLAEFTGRLAGKLSGGMKQKLGLAAALVHRPGVLLLDEPTTGVDPVTRQDFWQLIIRLAGKGEVAVLVSTPYMDEAARCTRVGFLQNGRLVVEGAPGALRLQLEGRVLELKGEPLPLLRRIARTDPGVEDAQMFGDRMHLRVRAGEAEAVAGRLQASIPAGGGRISRLRPVPPQLEDLFIALLEGEG
jgi:ABC-2 type transport system ATP-binding protein